MRDLARRLRDKMISRYFRNKNVGPKAHIDRSVHILGWRNIRVGERAVISEGGCLNVNHRGGLLPSITIGDRCFIGRRNFFSSGKLIQISDFTLTGPDCHFLGAGHVFDDPSRPYIATGVTRDNIIVVGSNCWLGASVTIVGNVTIGHGSVVGSRAVVTKSIPPFSLAIGFPALVTKRYDMISKRWLPAADFTAQMEAALPSEQAYLAGLKELGDVYPPAIAAGYAQGDLP